ncbi:MAG: AEC family transporter [Magnetococcus sp. DMHC-1]|nr:AEC family transporter [Magnetococcales bacterium]
MENFLMIVLALLLGMALQRLGVMPPDGALVLNRFVIHVSLPALVLTRVPQIVFSRDLWAPLLTPWILLVISAASILFLVRIFSWSRPVAGVLLLVVPLGNTSFLGIPMVQAFFGPSGVATALLYDQIGTFSALATYGTFIMAIYGDASQPTPGSILKKIVTFPPFMALLAALAVRSGTIPPPLEHVLETLANTLVPVVMVAVGMQFRLLLPRTMLLPLTMALGFKLLVSPLLAMALCHLAGWSGLTAQITIFESAMPPMITAGALAIAANLAPELAAAAVGLGILLSFATLPLVYSWIA